MTAFVHYYEVLGVPPTATTLEIRQAYRQRVALEHADLHGNDAAAVERTCRLNLARDVLVDPVSRQQFDLQRGAATFSVEPLLDTLARTFGIDPPHGRTVRYEPPTWLQAVAVGIVGAATVVSLAAAAVRAARAARNA